jgi:hypothetical protein
MFLWRLLMADELSTPTVSRWGYVVLDYIGLAFILIGPEEWVRTKLWMMPIVYIGIGAAFLFLGIMGPKIKSRVVGFIQSPKKLSEALAALDAANKRADENFGLYSDKAQELYESRATLREANRDLKPIVEMAPVVGPDLRVDYQKSASGRPSLLFKIRSGNPTTIRKVGPLVSEETYRTQSDFILLQEIIPEVEVDHPVECHISCLKNSGDLVSLKDALEDGGPTVSDSVVVEYMADGQQVSRRFFLYKNADGSVVWSTENRQPAPKDLRFLRTKLRSFQNATSDLTYAGEIWLLLEQSKALRKTLLELLASNANPLLGLGPTMDLSRPMNSKLIILDHNAEGRVLPWQRMRLMSFRDRYQAYNECCKDAKVPQLPFVPNDLDVIELCDAFENQQKAIGLVYDDIVKRYK